MPKIIVYDSGVATRLVINEFLSGTSDFIHIVWTGDAFGNYKAYKNGVLAGTQEGDPAAKTKRKYMWIGRLTLGTGFYLSDSTYSYIRFWQDTILDSNDVQQLYKARSDVHTPSPTITSPPTVLPSTAAPTTTHAPISVPTSMPPTMTPLPTSPRQTKFIASTFGQLQEAVSLLVDNAIIEINANISVNETLTLSGGYTNVTIRSTQGNQFTLVRTLLLHFCAFFISRIHSAVDCRMAAKP